jgi:hypothetical protein
VTRSSVHGNRLTQRILMSIRQQKAHPRKRSESQLESLDRGWLRISVIYRPGCWRSFKPPIETASRFSSISCQRRPALSNGIASFARDPDRRAGRLRPTPVRPPTPELPGAIPCGGYTGICQRQVNRGKIAPIGGDRSGRGRYDAARRVGSGSSTGWGSWLRSRSRWRGTA